MSSAELETSKRLARLRDLCAGDGARLDLLEAALALSALRHDEAIDLAPYRLHVAAMSADLADLVRRRGGTPESLAEVLAQSYAYRGDSETYDDLQNADLARVIERRQGLPVALSILYLHVARAQGWTAEGLAFPGHFLLRVEIDGARHVVDPFHDGCVRDAADLRDLLRQVLGSTAELRPATSIRYPIARCCCGSRTTSASGSPSERIGPVRRNRSTACWRSRRTGQNCCSRPDSSTRGSTSAGQRSPLSSGFSRSTAAAAIPNCASARQACCRNCAAGLTDGQ